MDISQTLPAGVDSFASGAAPNIPPKCSLQSPDQAKAGKEICANQECKQCMGQLLLGDRDSETLQEMTVNEAEPQAEVQIKDREYSGNEVGDCDHSDSTHCRHCI